MALIFKEYLSFLTFRVSTSQTISFGGNTEVLTRAATEAKNSSQV